MKNDFDPIAYEQELERTGVPHEQAAVHARALDAVASNCVTNRELDKVEERLREEIRTATSASDGNFTSLKGDLTLLREHAEEDRSRLDGLSADLKNVRARVDEIARRVDEIVVRVDASSGRLNEFGIRMNEFGIRMNGFEVRLDDMGARLEKLGSRLESMYKEFTDFRVATEARFARIEATLKMQNRISGLLIALIVAVMIKQYFP